MHLRVQIHLERRRLVLWRVQLGNLIARQEAVRRILARARGGGLRDWRQRSTCHSGWMPRVCVRWKGTPLNPASSVFILIETWMWSRHPCPRPLVSVLQQATSHTIFFFFFFGKGYADVSALSFDVVIIQVCYSPELLAAWERRKTRIWKIGSAAACNWSWSVCSWLRNSQCPTTCPSS